MSELAEKCLQYIQGSVRIGGVLALVDICNRLIDKYHTTFGEEAYQIIKTDFGFISLMGATLIENDLYIIGREVFMQQETVVYGKRIYAKVLDEMVIKKACAKMLYAIKSL